MSIGSNIELARLRATLEAETGDFDRKMQSARMVLREVERQHGMTGVAAEQHASKLTQLEQAFGRLHLGTVAVHTAIVAGTAAIGATSLAIGVATKEAIEFQSAMAGVSKTVNASDEQIKRLGDNLRALGRETGVSANTLAGIAATAGAAGVSVEDLPRVTRTAAQLTVAAPSLGNEEETTLGLVRLMKVSGETIDNVDKVASAIVHLGNNGASTEKEILDMSLRIAGAGRVAGLATPDILSLANAISSSGVEAEMGGTAISKTLIDMTNAVKGSTQESKERLADFARVAGMTSAQFQQAFAEDPARALQSFLAGLNRMDQAGQNVFGTLDALGIKEVRERDTILRLAQAQDDLNKSLADGAEGYQSANKHVEEFNKQQATAARQIAIARENAEDMARSFGGPLASAVAELAGAFGEALKAEAPFAQDVANELAPAIQGLVRDVKPLVEMLAHGIPGSVETAAASLITIREYIDAIRRAKEALDKTLNPGTSPTPERIGPPPPTTSLFEAIGGMLGGDYTHDVERTRSRMRGEPQPGYGSSGYPLNPQNYQPDLYSSGASDSVGSEAAAAAERVRIATENWQTWRDTMDEVEAAAQAAAAGQQDLGDSTETAGSAALTTADRLREAEAAAHGLAEAGSQGAAVMSALDAVLSSNASQKSINDLAGAVEKLKQSFKGLPSAASWGAQIDALVDAAVNGEEGARERLLAGLQTINDRVPEEKESQRKAEQEAQRRQREAEAAIKAAERELQRQRERHADLIAQFVRSSTEGAAAVEETYGKFGAKVAQALSNAFESDASGAQGTALGNALSEMINAAKKVGVSEAEAMGAEIKAALQRAISTKDEGDRATAQALIENLNAEIVAQSTLTPANFARSFLDAQSRSALGDSAGLMDAIKKSAEQGGPEALAAVGTAVDALRRKLLGNEGLTPEQAESYWASIMSQITAAIEDGGEDARQALSDALAALTPELLVTAAGNAMGERINVAIQNAQEQMREAEKTARERIFEAQRSLEESRVIRGLTEGVTETQRLELENVTRDLQRIRQDYTDFMETRERLHSRELEDAERLHQRNRQDAELVRQSREAQRSQSGTRGFSEKEIAEARASGVGIGPQNDPGYELFRRRQELARSRAEEDEEIKRKRGIEDTETARRRELRGQDNAYFQMLDATLDKFRRDQAKNLQIFQDSLADQQLARMIGPDGPIEKEKLARITKAQEALDEIDRIENDKFKKSLGRWALLYPALTGLLPEGQADQVSAGDAAVSNPKGTPLGGKLPGQDAEGGKIEVNVYVDGNVYGPGGERELAQVVGQQLAQQNHTQFVIGGLGRK